MTVNDRVRRGTRRNIKSGQSPTREKRVFSRVECLLDLEIGGSPARPGEIHPDAEQVEALDLSLIGLGFCRNGNSNHSPLAMGQTVSVGLHGFPSVQAQVRWNEGERVGVQFCGRLHEIVDSWVGEVLAAQGVRVRDLFEVTPSLSSSSMS